jgi:catechol 2,3-dioxygenase-like lactoylglutathione lyase family enzyme
MVVDAGLAVHRPRGSSACESPTSVIHHLGVFPADFAASKAFYERALGTLGITIGFESEGTAEFWHPDRDVPSLSLETASESAETTRGLHLSFEATSRADVDRFFEAAIAAGGNERHRPRHWPEYRAYCCFVSDPDGNNIEAVKKEVAS